MTEHVFTFGFGQVHPATGERLERRFLRVEAPDPEAARAVVERHFGKRYGMQYRSPAEAGVERFGLLELAREDWPSAAVPAKTVEDVMDAAREREKDDQVNEESDREERRLREEF